MRINERIGRKLKERACYSCGAEVPLSTLHSIDIMPNRTPVPPKKPRIFAWSSASCFIPHLQPPGSTLGESVLVAPLMPLADFAWSFWGHVKISSRETRSHFRFHYDVSSCFRGFDSNYRLWKLVVVVWNVYLQFLLEGTWCRFLRDGWLWRDLLKVGKVLMGFILRISFFFETFRFSLKRNSVKVQLGRILKLKTK